MALLRRLFKQGNSTVVSIPESYLTDLGLKPGDRVTIQIKRPKDRRPFVKMIAYDYKVDGRVYRDYELS